MTQKLFTRKKLISLLVAVSLGMTTTETSVGADSLFSDVTQDSTSTTHQFFFPKQIAQRNRTNYVFEGSISAEYPSSNIVVTPDGKRLISYGSAFNPNLERLSTSGSKPQPTIDGYIQVWNLANYQQENSFIDDKENFFRDGRYRLGSVTTTTDGKYLIGRGAYSRDNPADACSTCTIFWNLENGKRESSKELDSEDNQGVVISPDGKFLVTLGNRLKIWNFQTGQLLNSWVYSRYSNPVITPDGKYVIALRKAQRLLIRDLASGDLVKTIDIDSFPLINHLAITSDGNYLIITTAATYKLKDQRIGVYNLATGQLERTWVDDNLERIIVSPDGKYIISSGGHLIKIWNLQTGKLEQTLENTEAKSSVSVDGLSITWVLGSKRLEIKDVAVSPDGRIFVSSVDSNDIKVWKLQ